MLRLIPTYAHGVMDYVLAAVLLASPWTMGFAMNGPDLLNRIASKEQVGLLREITEFRNERQAHVGALDEAKIQTQVGELEDFVARLCEMTGDFWHRYPLIRCQGLTYAEKRFVVLAARAVGTRAPLLPQEIISTGPLEPGQLYAGEWQAGHFLPLLPTVVWRGTDLSPRFYTYLRNKRDHLEYVCYHHPESETLELDPSLLEGIL
jgi:hypothetical protein